MCFDVAQTLRAARVVGMTTTGVARMQQLVTGMQPKILIIEEAGELFEAHLLASLSSATEHVILIGECFSQLLQALHREKNFTL